jgi:hypothetical protein
MFAGGPDRIPVTTNPPGATVFVDNMPVGQTPTIVSLDRGRSSGVIRIEAAGYAPVVVTRDKSVIGWFWVNLLVWPGFLIDAITGNVKSFDDTPIAIGLAPVGAPPAPAYAPQPGTPPPPPPPPATPPPPPPPAAPPPAPRR